MFFALYIFREFVLVNFMRLFFVFPIRKESCVVFGFTLTFHV